MRTRGVGLVDVHIVVFIGWVLAAFGVVALRRLDERANEPKCRNNLKHLGLAAIQYADDKRFFPHTGRISALAGDEHSDEAAHSARLLVRYGYVDTPGAFVCPASRDRVFESAPL